MASQKIKKYLFSGAVFLLITMLWNIAFTAWLPARYAPGVFDADVPTAVLLGENLFRFLTFGFAFFLLLGLKTRAQKLGLGLYIGGVALYFAAWGMQMGLPDSGWSQSWLGYTAPAFTPLIWLVGIGLLGEEMVVEKLPYSRLAFLSLAVTFVGFHTTHALLAYLNFS